MKKSASSYSILNFNIKVHYKCILAKVRILITEIEKKCIKSVVNYNVFDMRKKCDIAYNF